MDTLNLGDNLIISFEKKCHSTLEFLENHVPHQPLQYVSGSDARTLRDAMGCFVTGITVVTTLDDTKKPIGLTVNSFSSVSLDPPLVSICLGNHVGSLDAFRAEKSFGINVLHTGQQSTSNVFASKTSFAACCMDIKNLFTF